MCLRKNISKYYGNLKFELLVLSSTRIRVKYCFSLKCFCLQITGNLSLVTLNKSLFFSNNQKLETSSLGPLNILDRDLPFSFIILGILTCILMYATLFLLVAATLLSIRSLSWAESRGGAAKHRKGSIC